MINKKYFIINYPLANSLIVLALLFHLWSGGSEFLGIQGYISDFMAEKFPDNIWAARLSLVIPLLLAMTIEFSFVALLRYVINSLLYKTLKHENIRKTIDATHKAAMQRYDLERSKYEADPDQYGLSEPVPPERPDIAVVRTANQVMFAMAVVAFAAIFLVSMLVSKKSIEHDTKVNGPQVNIEVAMDSLDRLALAATNEVYTMMNPELQRERLAFRRDSAAIVAEYTARIGALQEKVNEYGIMERRTKTSYSRSKSKRQQEIMGLEAERAQMISERSALLADKEQTIRSKYAPRFASVDRDFAQRKALKKQELKDRKDANDARNVWFSMFLRNYAQLATLGQFMCWVYVILAYYVMGIQKKPRVRPESLESGLLTDLGLLLYTAPTRFVHNRVRGLLSKVPPLHQMPGVGAVYDVDTLNEIAPLLEKLDKTKSLEEKEKLQRTINRKIAGYQQLLADSVETPGVESVENGRSWWPFWRRKQGVEKTLSTRSKGNVSTPDTTRSEDVENEASKRSKGVEKPDVENAVDDVATRSTGQGRGVEKQSDTTVEADPSTRSKGGVENVEKALKKGVEKKRRKDVATPSLTKGDPGPSGSVESREQLRIDSIYDVDIQEEIVLKVSHQGETKKEHKSIRVVIDGINVFGIVSQEQRNYAWFKKQVSTYEGFLKRGERDPINSQLKVQYYEAYMDLIERVEKDYYQTLVANRSKALD